MSIDFYDPVQDHDDTPEIPVALQPAWVEALWQWWVSHA